MTDKATKVALGEPESRSAAPTGSREPGSCSPSAKRLAYADPPYPGKAHLYPENTEVDHVELIAQLMGYDGWALSTDEVNLAYVLSLCPPKTRVLAWCKTNAPPFGSPYAAWEPVLCMPARVSGVPRARSYLESTKPPGNHRTTRLTGQKPVVFCQWVIRCLGALPGDTLYDVFPGTGVMGETFAAFSRQLSIETYFPIRKSMRSHKARQNMLRRIADPLPDMDAPEVAIERRRSA